MQEAARDPTTADGFICHLENHWFSIRPVAGQWWNFNSLLPAPQFLGSLYLESFLSTLKSQNWTIFVIQGNLPARADESMVQGSPMGRLWTPRDVRSLVIFWILAAGHESTSLAGCLTGFGQPVCTAQASLGTFMYMQHTSIHVQMPQLKRHTIGRAPS